LTEPSDNPKSGRAKGRRPSPGATEVSGGINFEDASPAAEVAEPAELASEVRESGRPPAADPNDRSGSAAGSSAQDSDGDVSRATVDVSEFLETVWPSSKLESADAGGTATQMPLRTREYPAHFPAATEAILFASDRPLTAVEVGTALGLADEFDVPTAWVEQIIEDLREDYAASNRGFNLVDIVGGWEFRTRSSYSAYVLQLTKKKPVRLSRAALEILAIVAYRQPCTRADVEDIRGVDCSNTLRQLLERQLIKILGKSDDVGRPLLYGTTREFLNYFGLKSLAELPTLKEFTELTEEHVVKVQELEETLAANSQSVDTNAPAIDARGWVESQPNSQTHVGDVVSSDASPAPEKSAADAESVSAQAARFVAEPDAADRRDSAPRPLPADPLAEDDEGNALADTEDAERLALDAAIADALGLMLASQLGDEETSASESLDEESLDESSNLLDKLTSNDAPVPPDSESSNAASEAGADGEPTTFVAEIDAEDDDR